MKKRLQYISCCFAICISILILGCATTPKLPTFDVKYIPEFTSGPTGMVLPVPGFEYKEYPRLFWLEENVIVCKTGEDIYLISARTGEVTQPSIEDQQQLSVTLEGLVSKRRKKTSAGKVALSLLLTLGRVSEYHYEGRITNPITGNYSDFSVKGATEMRRTSYGDRIYPTRCKVGFSSFDGICSTQTHIGWSGYDIVHSHHVLLSPNARYIITSMGYLHDTRLNLKKTRLAKLWQNYSPVSFSLSPDWSKIAFLEIDANGKKAIRITRFNLP